MKEVEVYLIDNRAEFHTRSGEATTFGIAIHNEIQKALYDVVTSSLDVKDTKLTRLYETTQTQELIANIEKIVSDSIIIESQSVLKVNDIAKYIVDEAFEPALELARDIHKDLTIARHAGRRQ